MKKTTNDANKNDQNKNIKIRTGIKAGPITGSWVPMMIT